jgi:hypothetical protein
MSHGGHAESYVMSDVGMGVSVAVGMGASASAGASADTNMLLVVWLVSDLQAGL